METCDHCGKEVEFTTTCECCLSVFCEDCVEEYIEDEFTFECPVCHSVVDK